MGGREKPAGNKVVLPDSLMRSHETKRGPDTILEQIPTGTSFDRPRLKFIA